MRDHELNGDVVLEGIPVLLELSEFSELLKLSELSELSEFSKLSELSRLAIDTIERMGLISHVKAD